MTCACARLDPDLPPARPVRRGGGVRERGIRTSEGRARPARAARGPVRGGGGWWCRGRLELSARGPARRADLAAAAAARRSITHLARRCPAPAEWRGWLQLRTGSGPGGAPARRLCRRAARRAPRGRDTGPRGARDGDRPGGAPAGAPARLARGSAGRRAPAPAPGAARPALGAGAPPPPASPHRTRGHRVPAGASRAKSSRDSQTPSRGGRSPAGVPSDGTRR